jgi:hypothetical protein
VLAERFSGSPAEAPGRGFDGHWAAKDAVAHEANRPEDRRGQSHTECATGHESSSLLHRIYSELGPPVQRDRDPCPAGGIGDQL